MRTRHTLSLILCLTALTTGTAAVRAQAQADTNTKPRKRRPPPNAMAAFLPFAPGASWKWRLTVDQRPPIDFEWRCVRQVWVGDAPTNASTLDDPIEQSRDELCWELRTLEGTERKWEYWTARKTGIFKFKNRFADSGLRGVTGKHATRLVPGPLGISSNWRWTEIGAHRTRGERGRPKRKELTLQYEGKLVSMSEKVTVPAGTFDAVRIQISRENRILGDTEETLWFARGTGLVKRVLIEKNGDHRSTFELLTYAPGTEVDGSVRSQIDALLATDAACKDRGKPTSLQPIADDSLDSHLGSKFFAARWKDGGVVFFRHYEGKTAVFHPGTKASWRTLLREEFIGLQRTDAMAVTKAFGVLWSHFASAKSRPVPHGSEVQTGRDGKFDVKAWIDHDDAAGKRVRGYARMWFEDGRLVRIESNVGPKASTTSELGAKK